MRQHAARAAALISCGAVVVAGLTGCSSSAPSQAPTASRSPVSSAPASTQVSSPATSAPPSSSTPATPLLPQPTSTAIKRRVTKPPGARPVSFATCLAGTDIIAEFLKGAVFGAVTPAIQQSNFVGSGQLATRELPKLARSRSAFLAAGYPRSFPTVRDLDNLITALHDLLSAIQAKDLVRLPAIYLRLSSAQDQFRNDTPDAICGG